MSSLTNIDPCTQHTEQLITAAAKRFGVNELRDHQLTVCLDYFHGKDAFLIAPTGFGKSLVYQVAPLVFNSQRSEQNSRVLIIEPTVALIDDSISKLKRFVPELPAVHLTPATITKAKSAIYIFASPEMILGQLCRDRILTDVDFIKTIAIIFIDECHIIEQWGISEKDLAFRDQYSKLGDLRSFTKCPVVAMTATVQYATIGFIKFSLNMDKCSETKIDIEKDNISYHVIAAKEGDPANLYFMVYLLKSHQKKLEKTMIFFTSIATLTTVYQYVREEIGQKIGEEFPLLAMYTSLTASDRKKEVIDDLNNPNGFTRVVLCTSSLAVGINVANVSYVIHYGSPTLTQDFLQETGRAARQHNEHAHSILLTFPHMNPKGLSTQMKLYVQGRSCRRKILLALYGSQSKQSGSRMCCDFCNPNMTYSFKQAIRKFYPAGSSEHTSVTSSRSSSFSAPSLNQLDFDGLDTESD